MLSLSRLRPAAVVTAIVVAAVSMLASLGVDDAIDARARRTFYALRGTRAHSESVLFVAIDGEVEYEPLIGTILAGAPRLVAVLDPDAEVPASLRTKDARLVVPDGLAPAQVALDGDAVEAVELGSDAPTITGEILRRLGRPARGRLEVDFLGPPDALPTLPARLVARGEVPATTFRDRVVVIGRHGDATRAVPTPVGAMSPAEVHAHALAALLDGATWRRPPGWLAGLLVLLSAIGAIAGVRWLRSPLLAAAALALVAAALVGAAYLLFVRAILLGVGAPLAALALGGFGGLLLERRDAHRELSRLRRTLTRRLGAGRAPDLDSPHERFVASLRALFGVRGAIWAELPSGAWQLDFNGWWDVRAEQVIERRRDVRRDPWRTPYGSHLPSWTTRTFLDVQLGQKTLLVPLSAGGHLHGFWILHLAQETRLGIAAMQLLTAMTHQLAIDRERQLAPVAARAALGGPLVDAVHEVHDASLRLGAIHERHRAVLEHLPVGVLVASLWGNVEYGNAAMRRFLAAAALRAPEEVGLTVLLQRLTGITGIGVRHVLRQLAGGGAAARLEARVAEVGGPRRYELVLERVRFPEPGEDADEHTPASLVLTATPRDEPIAPPPRTVTTNHLPHERTEPIRARANRRADSDTVDVVTSRWIKLPEA